MAVSEDFKIGDKVRVFDRRSMYYDKIGTIVKVIGKEFVCINLEVPYVDPDGKINYACNTVRRVLELVNPKKKYYPRIRWYSKGSFTDEHEKNE
jgi:hypothetical protein